VRKGPFITLTLLAGVLLGLVISAGMASVLEYTSTTQFCISCHEMRTVYQEYKLSSHYANAAGVRASCGDCHYPEHDWIKMVIRKSSAGAKDIYHHLRGTLATPEQFEAERRALAEKVWARMEGNDSLACRNCHSKVQSTAMELAKQQRRAQTMHREAIEKKQTCIDCHKGIAHKPVHENAQDLTSEGFGL
jgi:nitrate/TMAO reductase-like tetraheme cytochrome c subunit